MLCCQIERNEPSLLPFKSTLFKRFYDGPCDGLTTCEICQQGFFYSEIEYIDIGFRVYVFTEISINHYELAKNFGITLKPIESEKLYLELKDFPHDEQAGMLYSEFENLPFTHICLMGGYLSNALLWKKARPSDFDGFTLTDWSEYFGIVFDPETEYYHSSNKIWEEYLA